MATITRRARRGLALALASLLVVVPGCSSRLERSLHPPDPGPPPSSNPLKGHLKDGGVLLFRTWTFDEGTRLVSGTGVRLDRLRNEVAQGVLSIPLDSVALFETNRVHRGIPKGVLAITVVVGVVAVLCILNPKSCFGSCPTFYLDNGTHWKLVAESFSSSILPALEETDVDALPGVLPREGVVELRMTNEAQETHVVRSVDLLYIPRPDRGAAWATKDGGFVTTGFPLMPVAARGPEGDCLADLVALDGRERTSGVDSTDLGAREVLEFEFESAPEGELGIVLSTRQTLLSTYLFYQGLAWLGTRAPAWLASVEQGGAATARAPFRSIQGTLGGLDIEVEQAGSDAWSVTSTPFETGPIAIDTRLVRLDRRALASGRPIKVRLAMTRGYTRIDRVALAGVRGPVVPQRIRPSDVHRRGAPDPEALRDLLDPGRTLVTLPGDTCAIRYRLPTALARAPGDYEWFLEGRGYYLEWIRQQWLAEENPGRAFGLLMSPHDALRALAPEYARGEAAREETFWNSRYGSPTP